MKITKKDIKVAQNNYEKFYAWVERRFKVDLPYRVYATQVGDVFSIDQAWHYGTICNQAHIATIPVYPRFDPEFDPEKFYSI